MSFKNFFARSIRGWLPEEPKMPKSKLKRIRKPIAVLVVATTVVSLFSSVFMFLQTAMLLPPPLIVQSTPNSSYVELGGVLQQYNSSFLLFLTNGSRITSENLTLTFSVTERSGNECTAHIAVEADGFFKEASVDGSIVDGNLVIGSVRSIFLVNPNVAENQRIVLTEKDDWKLTVTVNSMTGKLSTAIDPYRVKSIVILAYQSRTETGLPMSMILGYDPTTGILVFFGCSFGDVLLKELGIDVIYGGSLGLVSYSENLNLEVANIPPPQMFNAGFILFLTLVSLLVALPIVAVVRVIRKKRKRRQMGALGIPELADNSTQNCDKRGW